MSVRRRPRRPEQEVWEGIRAQRVGGAHGLFSAAPVREQQTAVATALAGLSGSGDRDSQIDAFTCSGGAEDFTLTFLPQPDSWNVIISGVGLLDGTGYTVTDQTLNLLTAADARAGEKVQIQYDYLTGIPAVAQDPFTSLIESLGPMWWGRLSDVSNGGVLADSSGHARHGLWNSVTTHTLTSGLILGDPDQALSMTGAGGEGGKVTSASWMNLTTNMTWVIFFKTTDTSARLWAREQTSGGGQDWSLQLGGGLAFVAGGAGVATSVTGGLNDNNTHMAVFSYDSSNVRIYVDGTLDKTQAYSTPLGTAAMDMLIGHGGGTTTSHMYAGVLDEAIWFDKVLTDAEIAAIWDAAT